MNAKKVKQKTTCENHRQSQRNKRFFFHVENVFLFVTMIQGNKVIANNVMDMILLLFLRSLFTPRWSDIKKRYSLTNNFLQCTNTHSYSQFTQNRISGYRWCVWCNKNSDAWFRTQNDKKAICDVQIHKTRSTFIT